MKATRSRLLSCALIVLGSSHYLEAGVLRKLHLIPQRGDTWCWAASAEMALDYLYPDQKETIGQCYLAHQANLECGCEEPDEYLATDNGCALATPFDDENDFLLSLLPKVVTAIQTDTASPISKELLSCEIERRRAPVVFWWMDGPCEEAGHLAVAAGMQDTEKGMFVFAHDPWPPGDDGGESYWLSWKGFACGRFGYGHCKSYHNLSSSRPKAPCTPRRTHDEVLCSDPPLVHELVPSRSKVAPYLAALLSGRDGRKLRPQLGIPSGTLRAQCDSTLFLREAVPAMLDDSPTYQLTERTRVLCELRVGRSVTPVSVMLFHTSGGKHFVAGIGKGAWTDWVASESRLLVARAQAGSRFLSLPDAEPENTSDDTPNEVIEMFLPGAGQLILIYGRAPQPLMSVRFGETKSATLRTFDDILGESLRPGGPTIADWIREWASPGSSSGLR